MWKAVEKTPELAEGLEYWYGLKGKEALMEFTLRAMYSCVIKFGSDIMDVKLKNPYATRVTNIYYYRDRIYRDIKEDSPSMEYNIFYLLSHVGYNYGFRAREVIPTYLQERYHTYG